jgi:hypothetical protein
MEGSDIVKLNVGGVRYTTTLTTLRNRKENFLTKLVEHDRSGVMKAKRDESGSCSFFFACLRVFQKPNESHVDFFFDLVNACVGDIFIDRNGPLFEHVLDFLRTGELQFPPHVSIGQLMKEFDFYGIPIQNPDALTKEDAALRVRYAELCAKRDATFSPRLLELGRYGPLGPAEKLEGSLNAIKESIILAASAGYTCVVLRARLSGPVCSCFPLDSSNAYKVQFKELDVVKFAFAKVAAQAWATAMVDVLGVRAEVALNACCITLRWP